MNFGKMENILREKGFLIPENEKKRLAESLENAHRYELKYTSLLTIYTPGNSPHNIEGYDNFGLIFLDLKKREEQMAKEKKYNDYQNYSLD